MINFIKIDSNLMASQVLSKKNGEFYSLNVDDKPIGFGRFENCEENPIEIFVVENYRGNGYGTTLFKEMLKIAKNNNISKVKFIISNDNYIANRIVTHAKGIKVSTINNNSVYVLPISNNSYID